LKVNRKAQAPQLVRCVDLSYLVRRVSKIAKLTLSFVLSVCPSVRMEQLASTRRIFMKFSMIFQYFSKLCRQNLYSIKI
jgi:hypothetical protein